MMGGSDSRQSTTIYYREVDFSVAEHLNLAHISESDAKTHKFVDIDAENK